MIHSVQRLLSPREGGNPLAEAAIFMPKELSYALRHVFAFDVGGCSELEGDKIYRAMRDFTRRMHNKEMCVISFDAVEADATYPPFLYALAPITQAPEVIDFMADQVGPETYDLAVSTGMKRSFEPDSDILGWFDLDTPSFIFRNMRPAMLMCEMAGTTMAALPQIDRHRNYAPSAGERQKDAIPKMGVLARAWGRTITTHWNVEHVAVTPAGDVTLTPL